MTWAFETIATAIGPESLAREMVYGQSEETGDLLLYSTLSFTVGYIT
jgi:hypothetical protein